MDAGTLLTGMGVIASNVVTIVALYIHLDNKTDQKVEAIRQDVRSFHERLIKIEMERK